MSRKEGSRGAWTAGLIGFALGAIVAVLGMCVLMNYQERQHEAAIQALLDCSVTTGWAQAQDSQGHLHWLPLSGD